MTTLCAFAIAVSLVPAAGQAPKPSDPDLRELATYTLTMDTVNKVDRAMRSAVVQMKKDPRYLELTRAKDELKALQKKGEDTELTEAEQARMEALGPRIEELESDSELNMNDAKDLTEMAAKIERSPVLSAALRAEGLTPREYSKFMLAMLQAGFAAGLQKSGMLKETPEGVNPANIKFVLEHEAELKKLQDGGSGS